jgi:hypothetical protein
MPLCTRAARGCCGRARRFASGFFEIKARLPMVQGVVFALWTFHFETHRAKGDPVLHGQVDNQ